MVCEGAKAPYTIGLYPVALRPDYGEGVASDLRSAPEAAAARSFPMNLRQRCAKAAACSRAAASAEEPGSGGSHLSLPAVALRHRAL